MMVADLASISGVLEELRGLGCRIALDDFGTGYSSLSCLHEIPLNVLKIDQAFIATLGHDIQHSAIVHAIITLAGHLGLSVVAEGIETPEQMAQVLTLECDYGQGYLFSKPVDAAAAHRLVNEGFRLPRAA